MRRGRDQRHARCGMSGLRDPGINLLARKMSALAGLRSLGHFDLYLLCADQILAGHAEPAAGHLLDSRALILLASCRRKTLVALTALTTVGLAVQTVHGDGQTGMGLLGDGTIGHGTGLEPADDLILTLHLIKGYAALREVKVQETAEITGLLSVHHFRILLEPVIAALPGSCLQHMDRPGIVTVLFSLGPGFMPSQRRKGKVRIQAQRIKRPAVLLVCGLGDIRKSDPSDTAHRTGEIPLDHLSRDTHGFKDLAALIGLDGRDPHLRCDLYDTGQNSLIIIIYCCIVILLQQSVLHQLCDGGVSQIGIHCGSTVTQKSSEMMHLPGFTGFQDDGHGCTFPCQDKVLMHCRNRQQGGKRHMVLIHAAVRKDQDICSLAVSLVHLHEEMVDHPLDGGGFIIQGGHLCYGKAVLLHMLDLQKIQVRQDGIVDLQHMAVLRLLLQEIAILSQIYAAAGNDLLPLRVNGRIGDLGEELLEEIKQGLIFSGQCRDGGIHTHGSDLLDAPLGHAADTVMIILIGITEGLLQACTLLPGVGGNLHIRDLDVMQLQKVGVQPFAVGFLMGIFLLDLLVGIDPAFLCIHQQDLAGVETLLLQDMLLIQGKHAHLRGKDQAPVIHDHITGGS